MSSSNSVFRLDKDEIRDRELLVNEYEVSKIQFRRRKVEKERERLSSS